MRAVKCRPQPLNDHTTGLLGALLDLGALDKRLAERDQFAPQSLKRPRQRQGDHAVIEDAHAHAKAIEPANTDGVAPERKRRLVVLDVRRGERLGCEARRNGRTTNEAGNHAEINGFRDVEQVKQQNLTGADFLH